MSGANPGRLDPAKVRAALEQWLAELANSPAFAMYSPKNVPSPDVAATPGTSGRFSTPLARLPSVT